MPLSPVGDQLDERDTFAAPRAIDGAFSDLVRGDDVVAVGLLAWDAISDCFVDELFGERLPTRRRGVRVPIVFDNDYERAALDGGEIDPFMEGARRRRAVADVHEADPRLVAHLEAQRDARHHRHHVAKRRDLPDETARRVSEVNVQLAAPSRRIALCHILAENLDWRCSFHEHRAEIANQG